MNLARLNHVLIPGTKAERDRLRQSRVGRWLVAPAFRLYLALSSEGRAVLVLGLIAGAAGLQVDRSQNYWLFSVLVGLLFASICIRRLFALTGLSVEIRSADRVMVGQPLELDIVVRNHGTRGHHAVRFERPILPWDGTWIGEAPWLPQIAPGESVQLVTWARFAARGHHHLDAFQAAALAPGHLGQGPAIQSEGVRFVVVPKIASVKRLDLSRTQRLQPGGVSMASKTGESMELCGLRPYQPGDPVRDLHAVTSARIGSPVVRVYQQEYFSRIGVVVDTDARGLSEEHLEAAISLGAGVVACLARGEALVDLFVAEQERPVTVGRSLGSLDQALDALADVAPGPPFCAEQLVERLRPHLDRLSALVFVALSLDEERHRLLARLRPAGPCVRTLVVVEEDGGTLSLPPDPTLREVSMTAIQSGEALLL